MSTTSSSAVGPAGDAVYERRWWIAAAVALVVCIGYALIPADRLVLGTIVYSGLEATAGVAILIGIRRYRPRAPTAWRMLATALFAWAIADIIWSLHQAAGEEPFPSIGDLFYLTGYGLIAGAFMVAARARSSRLDLRTLIDPAIVTVVVAFAMWVYQIAPIIEEADSFGLGELVAVIYPLCDVALAGVAARLIFGARWGDRSLVLLVVALVLILAGDLQYASAIGDEVYSLVLADMLLLAGAACMGLAGAHRSMTALTEPPADDQQENVKGRVIGVAITALAVPTIVLAQHHNDDPLRLAAALVASTLLSALLVLRYAYSATRSRQAARRERTLSRYTAELLEGGDTDRLYGIAEKAAGQLIEGGSAVVVAPGDAAVTAPESLAVPVEVGGEREAVLVVARKDAPFRDTQEALAAVAAELSLALERQRLLARDQETARKLNEQMERLRELDRMKDQFVSSVSHELRTPLTSIVGYMELLLDGEAGELTEDQAHFLGIIGRNCDRLAKLVDDILFVARVDAGRLSLDLKEVDLAELAATRVESAHPVAARKNLDLRLDAEPGIPPLLADPVRIGELLDNLLSNAIKFTPEDGAVTVVVARHGDSAHIEVKDTGVGIPEDEVAKLFERFFRASTSQVAAGTGLGLSITKSIVEAHRGKIAVQSTVGTGTTFLVDLPLQAPPQAAAAVTTDEVHRA